VTTYIFFSSYSDLGIALLMCILLPSVVEAAKVIAQEPPASASESSSSSTGTKVPSGLVALEYAKIKASAHRVLQFHDKAKSTADLRDLECLN
jgi:hypothetical protein